MTGAMLTKAKCMPVCAATCGKKPASNPNMFERMIQNFESNGQMAIKKREGNMENQEERGVGAGEKPVFRNLEWKNFITGVTRPVCYMYLFHYSIIVIILRPFMQVDKPQLCEGVSGVSNKQTSDKQTKGIIISTIEISGSFIILMLYYNCACLKVV